MTTTLGYNLRSAILDAGYSPAWQLAQPIGKLLTARQRIEGAARPARGRDVEHFWKVEFRS